MRVFSDPDGIYSISVIISDEYLEKASQQFLYSLTNMINLPCLRKQYGDKFRVELSGRRTSSKAGERDVFEYEAIPQLTLCYFSVDKTYNRMARKRISSCDQIDNDATGFSEFGLEKCDEKSKLPIARAHVTAKIPKKHSMGLVKLIVKEIMSSSDPLWSNHLTAFVLGEVPDSDEMGLRASFSWLCDEHFADWDQFTTIFVNKLTELLQLQSHKSAIESSDLEPQGEAETSVENEVMMESKEFWLSDMSDVEFEAALKEFEAKLINGWPDNPLLEWKVILLLDSYRASREIVPLTTLKGGIPIEQLNEAIDTATFKSIELTFEPLQFPLGPSTNQRSWERVLNLQNLKSGDLDCVWKNLNQVIQDKWAVRAIVTLSILVEPMSKKLTARIIYVSNNFTSDLLAQLEKLELGVEPT